MSDFTDWKDDQHFVASEAVRIDLLGKDYVIVARAWWLNPVGFRSTRISIDVPELSEDKRSVVYRNMVAGWKCGQCNAVLFGTCISDLYHSPCCDGYVNAPH